MQEDASNGSSLINSQEPHRRGLGHIRVWRGAKTSSTSSTTPRDDQCMNGLHPLLIVQ